MELGGDPPAEGVDRVADISRKRTSDPPEVDDVRPRPGSKVCRADFHDESVKLYPSLAENGSFARGSKVFFPELRQLLISRGVTFGAVRPQWVCSSCVELGRRMVGGQTLEDLITAEENDMIRKVVSGIVENRLSQRNLEKLLQAIGHVCRVELKMMSSRRVNVLEEAATVNYHDLWRNNGLKVVRDLFEVITESRSAPAHALQKKVKSMQKAAESLCMVMTSPFISTAAVSESIVLHAITGSRFAVGMHAASNASGGHTYMTKLVDSIAIQTPQFPLGDIYVAFDNQQIVGREYRISTGNSQRTSVATTVCVFQESLNLSMQSNFKIPTSFPVPNPNAPQVWKKFLQHREKFDVIHREYRANWIQGRLQSVKEEMKFDNANLHDPKVRDWIFRDDYDGDAYFSRVIQCKSSCKVIDMESLPMNPNSYDSVEKVLDALLKLNVTSDPSRNWFVVCCDGLPYNIAWNIIHNIYICRNCSYRGTKDEASTHVCPNPAVHRKFEKILLRPGAGHIEINIVRTIFKEFFDVFIKPVAVLFGFNSPKSLDYCKSAHDHHKSWQILKVIFIALSDELIHLYGAEANNPTYDLASFQEWREGVQNPNIVLAFDFAFNILHPLFLFRDSVRRCNDSVALAAFYKSSSLFFGFNHPRYRELVSRDLFMQLSLPDTGSSTAKRYGFSLVKSDIGQGLDFLLEERNREQKRWVFCSGPPTFAQWKRASASLTFLERIKENVSKNLGLTLDHPCTKIKLSEEYVAVRCHFREVLQNIGPTLQTFSLKPISLNEKFVNVSALCTDNMNNYLQSFLGGRKCILSIVLATDLLHLPKEDVLKMALKKIKQLPTAQRGDLLERAQSSDINDLIEIIGETDEILQGIDYSLSFES